MASPLLHLAATGLGLARRPRIMPGAPTSSPSPEAAGPALEEAGRSLRQQLAERTAWLRLLHAVSATIGEAAAWDDGLQQVLRRLCETGRWQVGFIYLPAHESPDGLRAAIAWCEEPRFHRFSAASTRHVAVGESLPGRVYAEGTTVWVISQCELLRLIPYRADVARDLGLISAAAIPARFGGEVLAVLELFSTRAQVPTEELVSLMTDVATHIARVLERERSVTRIADLVWRDHQSLLHTLHDSLGQTLTGLGMLSSVLSQRLSGDPSADVARQIAQQAQFALEQVRSLSQGLFPFDIDADGLLAALQHLADTTTAVHAVPVTVEGEIPSAFRDRQVATQMYRIAQEAVTNAVKHGRPHAIRIALRTHGDEAILRIADDGVGLADVPSHQGLGLRIMRYRARSIGGSLSVGPGNGGGAVVTCSLRGASDAAVAHGWPERPSARDQERAG
jgi:signal transduction histidine kinase